MPESVPPLTLRVPGPMIPEEKRRMGPLGVPELIFIFVLALLIFGPKRLPEIGRTIGKGMAEFRKASTELKRTIN
ncbi:MAG: twin-arginine translocase TatA/TatE family subunit, partial [Thermoanaerobaculia bacterium]